MCLLCTAGEQIDKETMSISDIEVEMCKLADASTLI
jgi:hypothetical protein